MKRFAWNSLTLALGALVWGALTLNSVAKELPLGSLEGQLLMAESGKPLANKVLELWPINVDETTPYRRRFAVTDEQGRFKFKRIVAMAYRLETSAKAHTLKTKTLDVRPGETKVELQAEPVAPYLSVYASRHHYAPQKPPEFTADGFLPEGTLALRAYKLDFNRVLKEGSLYSALTPLARSENNKPAANPATMGTLVKSWDFDMKKKDAEGVFVETMKMDGLDEGLYWVVAKGKGAQPVGTWFSVSRLGLVSKLAEKDALLYAVDLESGNPVSGVSVGTVVDGVFQTKASTDTDGLARISAPDGSKAIFMGVQGQSRAFVDMYSGDYESTSLRLVTYTDRTIYRPGDEISFKGILRKQERDKLVMVEPKPVEVEFLNPDGERIAKTTANMTATGTFSGKFVTNKEDATGSYRIVVHRGDFVQESYVSVVSYKKPNFTINVKPEQPSYQRGDTAKADVQVDYYYGGPVPGAKVHATIYRHEDWSDPEYAEMFEDDYESYDYGGEYMTEVDGVTDANGNAIIEFPTRAMEEGQTDSENDYIYTVECSVSDESDNYFEGKGEVRVVRGAFQVKLDSDVYSLGVGEEFPVNAEVVDNEGKPMPGVTLTGKWGEMRWDGKESVFVDAENLNLTTNQDGKAKLNLKATRSGDYRLEVWATDQRGNRILDRRWVWVSGDGDVSRPWPKLDAFLDRKKYNAGDTAHLTVQADKPGGYALVTLEADRIYQSRVVELKGNSATLDIPVTDELIPNVMVSVCRVKDFEFGSTETTLKVAMGARALQVEVKADKESYLPGENATYSVTTKTASGAATSAEVSLAVVDESIFALAADRFDIQKALYPVRWSNVRTNYSFPDLYLDGGDKAPSNIQVRRLFKDTAYWNPTIVTDSQGQASVTVKLPDNLTQWRATARAITANSEAGTAVSTVVAKRDLMVRLEGPMFLTTGDEQTLTAMVSNRTGKDAQVHLQLESQGGAEIVGDKNQTVSVTGQGEGSVKITVKAVRPVSAKFTAKAWIDGGANDGVEKTIPVEASGRTYLTTTAGELSTKGSFTVTARDGASPDAGRLRVSIAPSLTLLLMGPLEDLIGFPYGCVEQTLSRFIPALAVTDLAKTSQLPMPPSAAQLPQITSDGLARLYRFQHNDGGWGWWEHDDSDAYMTGLVLDGLWNAKRLGIPVRQSAIDQGLKWANEFLTAREKADKWEKSEIPDRLCLIRSVGLFDPAGAKVHLTDRLRRQAEATNTAIVWAEMSRTQKMVGVDHSAAYAGLMALADRKDGMVSFGSEYWGEETNARSLAALVTINPHHEDIPKLMRLLLQRRKGAMWYSTRDTNLILMAMVEALKSRKETSPTGTVIVKLNGVEKSRVQLETSGAELHVDIPIAELKPGENTIELERSTPGPLYYGVYHRQIVQQEDPAELLNSSGLKITRTYRKMGSERLQNGDWAFQAMGGAVTSVQSGDLIEVELTVNTLNALQFVMIEDPIPSGCRVVESTDLDSWGWWWTDMDIRDDRVAIFVRNLYVANNSIKYRMRAETPGSCVVRPTTAAEMYNPSDMASTAGMKFEIKPK